MREKIIERLQNDRWERIGYLVDEILDMPVDGVQVRNTTGTTKFVCPLTIGEALEIILTMTTKLEVLQWALDKQIPINSGMFDYSQCVKDALTTKDGGIVEVKG